MDFLKNFSKDLMSIFLLIFSEFWLKTKRGFLGIFSEDLVLEDFYGNEDVLKNCLYSVLFQGLNIKDFKLLPLMKQT